MKKNTFPQIAYIISLLLLLFSMVGGMAQQDSQYTQYMYAPNVINPAYVGSAEVFKITSQYRSQWSGLDGAPKTINFTLDSPIGGSKKVGLGTTAILETTGPSTETLITGDLSYKIKVNRLTHISFGVKGGAQLINIDFNKIAINNTTDTQFMMGVENKISPVIGAGAYLYHDKWYLGVSVPNVLSTSFYYDNSVSTIIERPTLYTIGGYVMTLSDIIDFKPAFLTKMTGGAPMVFDLSANFLFHEKFTAGVSYRYQSDISALLGFQMKNLMIGYAYDMTTTKLANYSNGSHDLFLRFSIGAKKDLRLITNRFF